MYNKNQINKNDTYKKERFITLIIKKIDNYEIKTMICF